MKFIFFVHVAVAGFNIPLFTRLHPKVTAKGMYSPELYAHEYPYNTSDLSWCHPRIHTLGNSGFFGKIHASGARLFTKMIDDGPYSGMNLRREISRWIAASNYNSKVTVVDVGCGVGTFTEELATEFGDSNSIFGIDASPEMIMAASCENVNFVCANAAHFLPKSDIIVCGFLMHEQPPLVQRDLIHQFHNSLNLAGKVYIVDISQTYMPMGIMLIGEPFLESYLLFFEQVLKTECVNRFTLKKKEWIKGHVNVWILKKL